MPEPAPVALVGDLLATQAQVAGVAGILVDAAVRDVDELAALRLPIWARWVRVRGATKELVGTIDEPVTVGGALIRPGDVLVMDGDGAAVLDGGRVAKVLAAAKARDDGERAKRVKLRGGALSYDLDGLRARVERT
jgi:4-hydroxy-4-methyl-2-oxoglutarate aldolase